MSYYSGAGYTKLAVMCTLLFGTVQSKAASSLSFEVSMPLPSTHYYHVEFHINGMPQPLTDIKLPVWTPGYYWVENYAKNVLNFTVKDNQGHLLTWDKTASNTWRVATANKQSVTISYDVYAFSQSVADPFLDEGRGYIAPAGIFMYPAGRLQTPVSVTVLPYKKWKTVSTGLNPVMNKVLTFSAVDFDELYDCPIYIGNPETLSFEVKGIPYELTIENPGTFNRERFVADLKKMVVAGSEVIGEVPYKHYHFIIMGEGRGGLEHRNCMAVFSSSSVYNPNDSAGYKRWLSFLAHEYFHLYNIKSIRPLALGPFDYDKENLTHMLWVSEGFTVYYEYLILNRAGLLSKQDVLEQIQHNITSYEHIPGHLFQSATAASYDTWIQFFARGDNASNTTISYYDKGCALGFLLDLKIRHETKNKHTLDDVMKTLYRVFYKKKKRGFTDGEFRQVCEQVAGCALPEIFEVYASTVQDIDYPKYLAYAGLSIDVTPRQLPGVFTGATFRQEAGKMVVAGVEWNSPAWHGGLSAQDTVLLADGQTATPAALHLILSAKKEGDYLQLTTSVRGVQRQPELILETRRQKSFAIAELANPNELQKNMLKGLLQ